MANVRPDGTRALLASCLFFIFLAVPAYCAIPIAYSDSFHKITNSSIFFIWNANGNPPTQSYNLRVYKGATDPSPIDVNVLSASYEVTGLDPDTAYTADVSLTGGSSGVTLGTKYTMPQYFRANDVLAQPGDIISSTPKLDFRVKSIIMDMGTCSISVDDVPITDGNIAGRYDSAAVTSESGGVSYTQILYTRKSSLSEGPHKIGIQVEDSDGTIYSQSTGSSTSTTTGLRVVGPDNPVSISALCYPNPYDPLQGSARITYSLSANSDIIIYMIDVSGTLVNKILINSGAEGAHAGYNSYLWDGKGGFSTYLSNDVYLVLICSSDGKVLGRTKIFVLKSQ